MEHQDISLVCFGDSFAQNNKMNLLLSIFVAHHSSSESGTMRVPENSSIVQYLSLSRFHEQDIAISSTGLVQIASMFHLFPTQWHLSHQGPAHLVISARAWASLLSHIF
jgi:hypothetical protein